ncbi:hypothetical protein [Macellibacteroides fermentans]|uniref:hypothetical protein n=1 Tax=Macellibacteroides fermentans TaxID=879969 RepID=UPI00288EF804|nr:hypothetical protein [Bacteroidota bacterium]
MFEKLSNKCFLKSTALLLSFAMMFMSFTLPAGPVTLKSGSIIPLELLSTISSKDCRSGQMIDFKVTKDVVAEGKTVIPAGSIAKGQISRVKKSGLLGSEGQIEVVIRSVTAIDGTDVYLTGASLNDEGNNQVALSIVLTFLCLFGFLIKGGNAEIPAGTLCNATVAGNTTINVD